MTEPASIDSNLPSAAWYPDPRAPGNLRWWDGQRWTEHVAPGTTPQARAEPKIPDWAPFALTVAGGALALLGMVLPMVSFDGILSVSGLEGNTMLSQRGFALLIVPAAILACWRAFENHSNPGSAVAGPIGAGIVIMVLLFRETQTEVQLNSRVIETKPGLGIFVAGAGAVLILLGGIWQRAARS